MPVIPYRLIEGLPEPERTFVYQNFDDLDRRVQGFETGDSDLIVISPNGTKYKIIVSDAGALSTTPA